MTVDKQSVGEQKPAGAYTILPGLLEDDAVRETSLPELDRTPAPWESSM